MPQFYDVSDNTDADVVGTRQLKRRGVVIHETIGTDSLAWLQGGSARHGSPASCDFLISKVGNIYMLTTPSTYSFHSGRARWRLYQEKDGSINQGFFGVELENYPASGQTINTPQYIALAALLRYLLTWFDIDFRNVAGHYEVALPAGRKQDPVTLNWAMLTDELLLPSKEQSLYAFKGVR